MIMKIFDHEKTTFLFTSFTAMILSFIDSSERVRKIVDKFSICWMMSEQIMKSNEICCDVMTDKLEIWRDERLMICKRSTVKKDVTEIELRVDFITCFFAIFKKEDDWDSVFMIEHNIIVSCHMNYFDLIVMRRTCLCFIFYRQKISWRKNLDKC